MFKVAAFHLDTSVKMSLPLLKCPVSHSLVKFVPFRHKLYHADAVVTRQRSHNESPARDIIKLVYTDFDLLTNIIGECD